MRLVFVLVMAACGPSTKWEPPQVIRDDGFYVPTICYDCDLAGLDVQLVDHDGAPIDGGDGGQP